MNYLQIVDLALISIVIVIVVKLKGAQIASLKEQNITLGSQIEFLNSQIKSLGRFRVSEVEKDYDAAIKFAKRKEQEFLKTKKELEKLKTKIKQRKELKENEWEFLGSVVESTEKCLHNCTFCYSGLTIKDTYGKRDL